MKAIDGRINTEVKKGYKYGMRLRGFAPGCQPMDGFVRAEEGKCMGDSRRRYHNILFYNRKLTEDEIRDYELDDLNEVQRSNLHRIRVDRGLTVRELAKLADMSPRQIEYFDQNVGKTNKAACENVIRIAKVLKCKVTDLMD